MSHHKSRHGPAPVPPANLPKSGPTSGADEAENVQAHAGGKMPFQEQDPQRRIGDYEQRAEHSRQQPTQLNDGQQHSE
jgi:hypothetical protein